MDALDPTRPILAGPPPYCPSETVQGLTITFCGLPPGQQRGIIKAFASWPAPLLRKLAPSGQLEIVSLSRAELRRHFPDETPDKRVFLLQDGRLLLVGAERLGEDPLTFQLLLDPLRRNLTGRLEKTEEPAIRQGPSLLFPPDLRLAARTAVKQFLSHGLQYHPSRIFHAELGLAETVGENGASSHQVRFRTTNPEFNRWVYSLFVDPVVSLDPDLQIYAGFFATAASHPAGLVGAASWGADAELTTVGGYEVFLDSNLQHRVRSSGEIPSDQLVVENTLRLQSPDRRLAFGISTTTGLLPRPEARLSLSGSLLFD